jgi:hypothetical protein
MKGEYMHSRIISQNQKILKYMKTHRRGITQKDAASLFGCYRLSARIFDLKEQGNNIYKEMEEVVHADGSISRFARYFLHS